MKTILRISLIILFTFAAGADAQFDGQEAEQKGFAELSRSGKLVQLKMETDAKQITFTFSGKDVAKAKIIEDGVEVSYKLAGVTKIVRLSRVGDKTSTKYRLRNEDLPAEKFRLRVKTSTGEDVFELDKP